MEEGTVDSTLDTEQWLTLGEAAQALGVSEKTVRRRVKAGQLHGRQAPSPRGPAWQVRLPSTIPTVDRVDSQGTQDNHAATVLELVRLVDRLQVENRDLSAAAAVWQERARVLEERLAIAAPAERPVEGHTAPQPPDPTTESSTAAPERPVWLRWLVVAIGLGMIAMTALYAVWPR